MAANPLPAKAWGPYASEQDALSEPMPQDVHDLHQSSRARRGDPDRLVRDTVEQHLLAVCTESGVKLGAHDRRILAWPSDRDTGSNQVIIGLIRRAYACGIAKVQTGAGR